MYQCLTPSWWSLTFVEFNRLKPLRYFFSILGISEGDCFSFEIERDSEAAVGWRQEQREGADVLGLRLSCGCRKSCLGGVSSLLGNFRLSPENRRDSSHRHRAVSSGGTRPGNVGTSYMGNLSWLLIPWPRLCHMAAIQKCPGWGRDLFSSSLSKPTLLGLLPLLGIWRIQNKRRGAANRPLLSLYKVRQHLSRT